MAEPLCEGVLSPDVAIERFIIECPAVVAGGMPMAGCSDVSAALEKPGLAHHVEMLNRHRLDSILPAELD